MAYLLDTDICIGIINRRAPKVIAKLQEFQPGDLFVSTITVAELRFGAAKSQAVRRNHEALDSFLLPFMLLDFDELSATAYGAIRSFLERKGTPIGSMDTLIAAQAVAHQLILVTGNQREFRRVSELRVENWQ
jgi:tRNA(fMet)-specific endonuclease VapC